jgi:hypothetical protein
MASQNERRDWQRTIEEDMIEQLSMARQPPPRQASLNFIRSPSYIVTGFFFLQILFLHNLNLIFHCFNASNVYLQGNSPSRTHQSAAMHLTQQQGTASEAIDEATRGARPPFAPSPLSIPLLL